MKQNRAMSRRGGGFTLIELLIVIAIIAILALIAIPNFLEAQTRSKVARVTADMRSIAIGLEAYFIDWNYYPICLGRAGGDKNTWGSGGTNDLYPLSTPVAYLTSVNFFDPFRTNAAGTEQDPKTLEFANLRFIRTVKYAYGMRDKGEWVLCSLGPDQKKGPDPYGITSPWWAEYYYFSLKEDSHYGGAGYRFIAWNYDPTNGTVSNGDILRWQKTEDQ